jgi:membrane protein involved in colicin uptake
MTLFPRHRLLLGVAFALAGISAAHARDEDYQRLLDRFNQLATDPALGTRAPIAMDRARLSLAHLKEARRGEREHWIYVTERRIDTARTSAELESFEEQHVTLQRENDRLQLALARRDAEQARAELERQRLQSQIRAEEAESARRDADAARAEGAQATQAAEAARAEADQAKKMAAAQAKATALAKKQAELEAALSGNGKGKSDAAPKTKSKPKTPPPKQQD